MAIKGKDRIPLNEEQLDQVAGGVLGQINFDVVEMEEDEE